MAEQRVSVDEILNGNEELRREVMVEELCDRCAVALKHRLERIEVDAVLIFVDRQSGTCFLSSAVPKEALEVILREFLR